MMEKLNTKLFDHTILKADATKEAVLKVCREAKEYNFMSVCVNGFYTVLVKKELEGTDVKVCTVVGFPLGQMSTKAKAMEAAIAVEDGADEIDMVINVAALKDGEEETVYQDILAVRRACEKQTLKVIIETCLLTDNTLIELGRETILAEWNLEQEVEQTIGMPFLMEIPILKYLFSTTTTSLEKTRFYLAVTAEMLDTARPAPADCCFSLSFIN